MCYSSHIYAPSPLIIRTANCDIVLFTVCLPLPLGWPHLKPSAPNELLFSVSAFVRSRLGILLLIIFKSEYSLPQNSLFAATYNPRTQSFSRRLLMEWQGIIEYEGPPVMMNMCFSQSGIPVATTATPPLSRRFQISCCFYLIVECFVCGFVNLWE